MLLREDSHQDQQTVSSRATAAMRAQREVLRNLLEETRAAHGRYSSEYRELQGKLAQVSAQMDQVQAGDGERDTAHERAVQMTSLRDLDCSLRQRLEWLSEKLLELQTTGRKLRSVLQQLDDSIGYLTSAVSSDNDGGDETTHLSRVRLLQAQEDERQRLAREIHDGPAQALANAIFEMEYCERLLEKNPRQMKKELSRLKQDLREALADVRYFISDLRPAPLSELGLEPVLRRYVEEYQSRFGIRVNARLGAIGRLPGPQELAIFRIVQEALQNTRKHSGASEVNLQFTFDSEALTVIIQDNGAGFDVQKYEKGEGRHFGLTSMVERARLIGAELHVVSGNGGTTVTLMVPRPAEKAQV